jgi:copper(I)-binding protein
MRSQDRLLERNGVNSAGEGLTLAGRDFPTFTGVLVEGEVLTGVNGTFAGSPTITITRAWLRDGTPIAGATGATYTLVSADDGAVIRFRNTAANAIRSVVADSLPSITVAGFPIVDDLPTIAGTAQVGEVLTGTPGTFLGKATITVTNEWLRDGVPIAGETGATYTLVADDEDAVITFRSTGTNDYGAAVSVSAPTAAVIPA